MRRQDADEQPFRLDFFCIDAQGVAARRQQDIAPAARGQRRRLFGILRPCHCVAPILAPVLRPLDARIGNMQRVGTGADGLRRADGEGMRRVDDAFGALPHEPRRHGRFIQRADVAGRALRQKLPRVFARHADPHILAARQCQRSLLAALGRAAKDDSFHRHSLSIHSGCDRKCRCAKPAVVCPLCIPPGQHRPSLLALRISKSYSASSVAFVTA